MGHTAQKPFTPSRVAVITVSDTRTRSNDTSGDLICQRLQAAGHQLTDRYLIPDEVPVIHDQVKTLLEAKHCQFIIITGGTGLNPRDITPEAIQPLITKPIPGFGELFRMLSFREIGTSTLQSRAEASLCGQVVVFAIPGSTNACRLAMDDIILQQIDPTHRPCNFRGLVLP